MRRRHRRPWNAVVSPRSRFAVPCGLVVLGLLVLSTVPIADRTVLLAWGLAIREAYFGQEIFALGHL